MNSKIEHIRTLLSKLMMYSAIGIVIIGLILHLQSGTPIVLNEFSAAFEFKWHPFVQQLFVGDSYAVCMLGILILMAIPVMRIFLYVFEFAVQKNRLYLGISLLIIGVLLFSLFMGR